MVWFVTYLPKIYRPGYTSWVPGTRTAIRDRSGRVKMFQSKKLAEAAARSDLRWLHGVDPAYVGFDPVTKRTVTE